MLGYRTEYSSVVTCVRKDFRQDFLTYLALQLEMCGTKKIILHRDRDQRKILAGLEPGPKKNYRDRNRDQIKRDTGTWTGTGTKKSWSRISLVATLPNSF